MFAQFVKSSENVEWIMWHLSFMTWTWWSSDWNEFYWSEQVMLDLIMKSRLISEVAQSSVHSEWRIWSIQIYCSVRWKFAMSYRKIMQCYSEGYFRYIALAVNGRGLYFEVKTIQWKLALRESWLISHLAMKATLAQSQIVFHSANNRTLAPVIGHL